VIVDPTVLPGLLLLAAELGVLAAVGYVVVRVALRQDDELSALAQGLVVGPALWGIVVNFTLHIVPGLAGAGAGWAVVIGLGAALAWRSPTRLPMSPRTVAGLAGAVLVLSWVALASRQLLGISDLHTSLGLAATLRYGGFPVMLPWQSETPAAYHYGSGLLVGLLAPPIGPDLGFVRELIGAYAWTSLALVVVTALRHRGSWLTTCLLAPLLISHGMHTSVSKEVSILLVPMPSGLPMADTRAAMAGIYWPTGEPVGSRLGSLPDVWNPAFTLGHALVLIVVRQAARTGRPTWSGGLTLAGLVGFLGLLVTTLVPVALVIWIGLDALRVIQARRSGVAALTPALRSAFGLAAAGLLILFGGGALSANMGAGMSSGLALTGVLDASHWQVVGTIDARHGGVGLVGLGPVAVAGLAIALAWRDRLVVALAAGALLLALAWLAFDYPPFPQDLGRVAGHSRNLALVALLLALSVNLARLSSKRGRYTLSALLVALVVWPTVAGPVRSAVSSLGHGIQLSDAGRGWRKARELGHEVQPRRFLMPHLSSRLATYIRTHTAVDAPVLDPSPDLEVLLHTGRPSNFGFTDVTQLIQRHGPEYLDASHYLEPAAFRTLGLAYVYATESWVAGLPARARQRLADPGLFDLVIRDGPEAIYRVRPAFLALEAPPHPDSFEALRGGVAPGTVVYLRPQTRGELKERLLRVASALPQARLVGEISPERLHLRTPAPWTVEPLGAHVPQLIALPLLHEAWTYPPAGWQEVWRNPPGGVAVYAPARDGEPAAAAAPPVRVRLTDMHAREARLRFTATLDAPEQRQWSGQDWVLGAVDTSPWAIPVLQRDGQLIIEQWFAGQAAAGAGTTTRTYVFDASDSSLHVRGADGAFASVAASTRSPMAGTWMLALRLTARGDSGHQDVLFIVPVLRFDVSDDGTVSSPQVYDARHGWRPS